MAAKDFKQPDDGDEVLGASGSDASGAAHPEASGPDAPGDPDSDDLTIDDILAASQTDEALVGDDAVDLPPEAAGYLADLKRLTAEYANYRRRTEEQREIDKQRAQGEVGKALLPVLDDIDRAAAHGDLTEGSAFAVIAEKLRGIADRLGLVPYGEKGELFDPQDHEAIFQQPTPGTTAPTIIEVIETGYRLGEVELRPAKVVVAVPAE